MLSLPVLPFAVQWLKETLGAGSLSWVTPAALAAIALAVAARRGMSWPRTRILVRLLPLGLAGCVLLWYLRNNPVEQVHLVEYGLLGWLAMRAAEQGGAALPGRVMWAVAAPLAGFADEIIQGFLPNRVFDWRDVAVNAASGVLGLLAARAAGRRRFDTRRCGA